MFVGKDIIKGRYAVLFKNCITHDKGYSLSGGSLSSFSPRQGESTTLEYFINFWKVCCCDQSVLVKKCVSSRVRLRTRNLQTMQFCLKFVTKMSCCEDVAKTSQFWCRFVVMLSHSNVTEMSKCYVHIT